MISVLCMGVWFIAVSNHMKKRGRCQRQLPQKQRVMLMESEWRCYTVTTLSLAMRYSTCTRVRATGMMDKMVAGGGG